MGDGVGEAEREDLNEMRFITVLEGGIHYFFIILLMCKILDTTF